jgi:hypothetical protein
MGGDQIIRAVKAKLVVDSKPASDSRFAGPASAAYPSDVVQSSRQVLKFTGRTSQRPLV